MSADEKHLFSLLDNLMKTPNVDTVEFQAVPIKDKQPEIVVVANYKTGYKKVYNIGQSCKLCQILRR